MIKENEQQARQAQQEGVEQQRDDVKGADGIAQRGAGGQRHQHLRTIGEDSLKDARERIQQGSGALGADAVLLGDLLGDRPRHDDGNGVVGGGNVHEAHQQTNAELTAALSAKHPADEGEDALEAAVGADQAAQRGDQQRHQNGLEHARHAAAHIALEPNLGLDSVLDDEYLHNLAQLLGETGRPIFLRYASEMNGNWTNYSGDPELYIEKWRLVHDVMEKEAPNVIMVWTVFTSPTSTMAAYYPGDAYVDWVGVNIYNVVYHNNDIEQYAADEDPLELLDYVYDTYSDKKPIQISEYGVTHYTVTDNAKYVDFAISKLERLYKGLKTDYPRVKSIFYFDVNNTANAPEGRQINNYALTDELRILETYKSLIADPYFLSDLQPASLQSMVHK